MIVGEAVLWTELLLAFLIFRDVSTLLIECEEGTYITADWGKQHFAAFASGTGGTRLGFTRFTSHDGALSGDMLLHADIGVLARRYGYNFIAKWA